MNGSPAMRRRRLAAIREKLSRRSVVDYREADLDDGSRVNVVLSDGSTRPATADERTEWATGAPRVAWDLVIGSDRIARPVNIPTASRITGVPRTSTTRTTRTTSRRARTTSALSAADPSSSRGRLSANALGHLRIETTHLGLRLALLGIGGPR
ncbi:MAG: hypothetical protein EXQ67_06840 [Thermoleophilia bacterium]|nr:hypothetical protein [Thermoleophilia bacterium]